MRPSWPAPMMPIFMVISSSLTGVRVIQHGIGLGGAKLLQRLMELRMAGAEDAGGQQRGIHRTGLADGQGSDGNPGGHLHYRQQRVDARSEEHTSELQSRPHLVCRLLLEKKKKNKHNARNDIKR